MSCVCLTCIELMIYINARNYTKSINDKRGFVASAFKYSRFYKTFFNWKKQFSICTVALLLSSCVWLLFIKVIYLWVLHSHGDCRKIAVQVVLTKDTAWNVTFSHLAEGNWFDKCHFSKGLHSSCLLALSICFKSFFPCLSFTFLVLLIIVWSHNINKCINACVCMYVCMFVCM